MDLIHKIESLRYDIENGVETDVINISVRLIQIKDQALQLLQPAVSSCSSEDEDFYCGVHRPKCSSQCSECECSE
jgi:hypothetical protein